MTTNTNTTTAENDEAGRRLWAELQITRLFCPLPISWDEVEEILPFLTRDNAQRFIAGEATDFTQRTLFIELFRWHPGLALTLPEPVRHSTSIVFRMTPPAAAGAATLTAAASPSCADEASGDKPLPDEEWLTIDDGLKLRLARHMRTGWMTLQLVGRTVTETATVWVDERQIELVERFSPDGFAVVKDEDVVPVLRGAAVLKIKFL